jgi:hypothetical protein
MFFIQVQMRVERDLAMIRVLPDDADPSGLARKAHRLDNGNGCAGCFNRNICAAPVGVFQHPLLSLFFGMRFDVERGDGSHRRCYL